MCKAFEFYGGNFRFLEDFPFSSRNDEEKRKKEIV